MLAKHSVLHILYLHIKDKGESLCVSLISHRKILLENQVYCAVCFETCLQKLPFCSLFLLLFGQFWDLFGYLESWMTDI